MVKSKKEVSWLDLPKSLFVYDVFTNKINKNVLIMYNLIILFLLSIVAVLNNSVENYSTTSNVSAFFSVLIGVVLLTLGVYTLFYIFIRAFDVKTGKFLESYLVFLVIFLPITLVGNFVGWLVNLFEYIPFVSLLLLIVVFLVMYFIVLFVVTFKNYFKTDWHKVVASMIVISLFNFLLGVISYLSYLISALR